MIGQTITANLSLMQQQVLDLIQEVVDRLNSQRVGPKIACRDTSEGRVYASQDRELVVQFFSLDDFYVRSFEQREILKRQHAVHAGSIEIREGRDIREGWNLVLLQPAESIYGEWQIVETRLSPTTIYGAKYEPFATDAETLAENLACHWKPEVDVYRLKLKSLEREDVDGILKRFIRES